MTGQKRARKSQKVPMPTTMPSHKLWTRQITSEAIAAAVSRTLVSPLPDKAGVIKAAKTAMGTKCKKRNQKLETRRPESANPAKRGRYVAKAIKRMVTVAVTFLQIQQLEVQVRPLSTTRPTRPRARPSTKYSGRWLKTATRPGRPDPKRGRYPVPCAFSGAG